MKSAASHIININVDRENKDNMPICQTASHLTWPQTVHMTTTRTHGHRRRHQTEQSRHVGPTKSQQTTARIHIASFVTCSISSSDTRTKAIGYHHVRSNVSHQSSVSHAPAHSTVCGSAHGRLV